MKTCCFTGHRPDKLPWKENEKSAKCIEIKNQLKNHVLKLIEQGYDMFICGMALGCDSYFAECICELKDKYKISLECAIPCKNQTKFWKMSNKIRYNNFLKKADKITILSDFYTPYCMQERNKYMVDKSDIVLTIWNGSALGGTYFTVKYARENEKQVEVISLPYSNS